MEQDWNLSSALKGREELGSTVGPPAFYDMQDRIEQLEKEVKALARKVDLLLNQTDSGMRIAS